MSSFTETWPADFMYSMIESSLFLLRCKNSSREKVTDQRESKINTQKSL